MTTTIQDYLDGLQDQVWDCDTSHECEKLAASFRLDAKKARAVATFAENVLMTDATDLFSVLSMELEHVYGSIETLADDLDARAKSIQEDEAEDAIYGSYEDQVRTTYREGAI